MKPETVELYEQVREGDFDDDLIFLQKAFEARWLKINPTERILREAGIKLTTDYKIGQVWKVSHSVSPKYLRGSLVSIVGVDSNDANHVRVSFQKIPKMGNRRNANFKVGSTTKMTLSLLAEKVE